MTYFSRPKPVQTTSASSQATSTSGQPTRASSQRATQVAAFDEICKSRPLRPPTSNRPEVRVIRKPLPTDPRI